MRSVFTAGLFIIAAVVFVCGCTREIKELGENPGLDTIPFYPSGSSAFDTRAAIKAEEDEKKLEEQRKAGLSEEIKKRVEDQGAGLEMPDPWIAPAFIKPIELPLALRGFPKDKFGYPDWTAAVRKEVIKPRGVIAEGEAEPQEASSVKDILFEINDLRMANVVFPHNVHTYWFSCKVCHPSIFIDKKGANKFNMYDIWNGQYCGRCHGKVAFQAKGFENCQRCHSSKKKSSGMR